MNFLRLSVIMQLVICNSFQFEYCCVIFIGHNFLRSQLSVSLHRSCPYQYAVGSKAPHPRVAAELEVGVGEVGCCRWVTNGAG